ncbi:MAG: hypothetical protein ACJ74U_15185 [Jatrophihabitantaceae bacterium]
MHTISFIAVALVATAIASALAARYRQARYTARNPLAQAFRMRELDELDAHLEAVARQEHRRLENELARYLAGRAGHVVVVSRAANGIALELSDGHRLALRGISRRTVDLLNRCAPMDMLHPSSFDRDALSYRLLLRGRAGAEVEIYARNIALIS